MIKTEQQYKEARRKCQEGSEQLQNQIQGLQDRGYEDDEIHCLTAGTARMLDESCQSVELYRRLKAKDPSALGELPLNRQLIGLRIFLGLSQSKLAERMGVPRSEVVRGEKDEYRDLTLQRYREVLEAMGLRTVPTYVQGDWQDAVSWREQLLQLALVKPDSIMIG